ncbi:hypothetical protein NC796_24110 [Aliifodinibius sp. S!AR15-10]|uniref:FliH/SctL family protein n=1 Tax=Aliifodinibius sp. S!AR15-10 TaxID=2950437 RepID=UPI00285DF70C|nr:hypothetical protein [Aliifodinibius sp. S!AR15-10]MDR8394255.1 hypothetical protein [Aliifodinibius sp. S!AR15-10]
MQNQKILDSDQISWYSEEKAQLDYEMIFNEAGEAAREEEKRKEEEVDFKKLLRERDRKWKMRLKKAREHAYAEGFEEGKQKGRQEARAEIDDRLTALQGIVEASHKEWEKRQKLLDPGLLDLVFDLAESILGIPVENPAIREKLDEELGALLQRVGDHATPLLWVSETDYEYVEQLKSKYNAQASVNIQVSEECNPGEFKFETDQKTVVCDFREMLHNFKQNLSLPSWQ